MNGRFLVLFAIFSVATKVDAEDLRLLLSNGDSLPGTVESLEGNALKWKSPLFDKAVTLDSNSLRTVAFPGESGLVEVKEPFRIDTASGDIIYGSLTGIDEKTATVESGRHGTMTLKRAEIISMRRLSNSAFIALGGLGGWGTLDPDRKMDVWRPGIRGRIETGSRFAELFRNLELPELAEIELALSWNKVPGFVFGITREDDVRNPGSISLETWGEEVVVIKGRSFEPVKRLSKSAGRLHLRIYLNRKTGEVTVCSYEGRQLAQIAGEAEIGGGQRGLYIRNKRSDLSLETLRIGRWNGQLPTPVNAGENRLHLVGGDLVYGSVKSYDAEAKSLVVDHEGKQTEVPIDNLDTLYFSGTPRQDSGGATEISFHDGAVLRGTLERLSATEARVKTPLSDQPITCKLDRCREINWPSKDQNPPDRGDVLFWNEGKTHGAIVGIEGEDFPIGWKPIGAKAAAPLVKSETIRILRRDVNSNPSVDPKFPDAIYLSDFTALPCRVTGVQDGGALVSTPFNSEPVTVENALLKAIEFQRPEPVKGFEDGRWKASSDGIDWNAREAKFEKIGRLSHPSALAGSEVRFKLAVEKGANAQLQLRLFSESAESGSDAAATCTISCSSTYMNVAGNNPMRRKSVRLTSSQAEFVVTSIGDRIVVEVNGTVVVTEDLNGGRPGRGIDFVVTSLRNSRGKPEGSLRIFDFSVGNAAGSTAFFVPNDVKERMLTVPRLRKSNPPKHLVAAQNGDLLRGELISVDAENVKFRSKLRDLQIPRNRVAGIVWLHDADEIPATSGSTRILLAENRVLAVDPESLQSNQITGRSGVFGVARIPLNQIREIHLGDYVPPTSVAPYADWKLRPAKEPNPVGGP